MSLIATRHALHRAPLGGLGDAWLDIVTPEGVARRVMSLDSAWQTLRSSREPVVHSELTAWNKWRNTILNSYFSRLFATGTLNELDSWEQRYAAAFDAAGSPNTAPRPTAVGQPKPQLAAPLPWAFYAGAGAVVLLIGFGMYVARR